MGAPTAHELDHAVAAADAFDPHSKVGAASTSCPARNVAVPKGCEGVHKCGRPNVQTQNGTYDKRRAPTMTSVPIESTHIFRGETKPRPTTERVVTVKGRAITIIRPSDGSMKGKNVPSDEQIANSLAALDERQLDSLDEVVVNPNQNPDDAEWARKKNNPNFRSQASAGPRVVDWYPSPSTYPKPTQADVDGTFQHEAGHEYAHRLPKEDLEKWNDAIKADKEGVSSYGNTSEDEDIAEFSELFAMYRGTKCEATLQKLYPNRYALMKDFMSRPSVKHKPPPPPEPKPYRAYNPFDDTYTIIYPPGTKPPKSDGSDDLIDPTKE